MKDFDAKAAKIQGEAQLGYPRGGKPKPTFTLMNSELASLSETVNQADAAPTVAMNTAYHDYCQDLNKLAQQWSELMKQDLPGLNAQLTQHRMPPLSAAMQDPTGQACGNSVVLPGPDPDVTTCPSLARDRVLRRYSIPATSWGGIRWRRHS